MDVSRQPDPEKPQVGVRELRQNLSVYLDRIKRGEHLVVTERGVPVARLAPLTPAEDVLASLVREGLARPPLVLGGVRAMRPPLKRTHDGPSPSELLVQSREEERF